MMKFMMITMRSRGIGTSISSNFFFALMQSSFAFSMSPLCRVSFNFSFALL